MPCGRKALRPEQSWPLLLCPQFADPSELLTHWTTSKAFRGIFLGFFFCCCCLLCHRLCPICYVMTLDIFCFHSRAYDAHEWIGISCISNKVACVPQISHIDLRPRPATEGLNTKSGLLCRHQYMLVPVKSCYLPVIIELFTYRKYQYL